jgi:hypothetical protein
MAQTDEPDMAIMQKIRNEGFTNSQVMDFAFYLTDVSGPRLNNSPGFKRAANWARHTFAQWGLENARLETWGEWGKGWELKRCYVAMSAPYYKPVIAFPKSWTAGTQGLQQADVMLVTVQDTSDLELYKGRLHGKVILLPRYDSLQPAYIADASRYSEEELKEMQQWRPEQNNTTAAKSGHTHDAPILTFNKVKEFVREEGAVAILSTSPRGRDGTLFVQGGGAWAAHAPENFPDIMLAFEDYMLVQRLVQKRIPVKLELDIRTQFHTADLNGYNVIAEIKGTDPKLKNELVMIGAHLDSWHASVGATDNAAGCAVMMEVIRIFKALNIKPRRTIRIALWGGEEQGLIGSKNYVRQHFMDTLTHRYNKEGDKLSAYFNLDNGTGKIRGVYLQGNDKVQPLFAKWLQPFNNLGATTTTLQNTGGTDHLSFDAIGLPAFQFIQDDIEYDTRTHHTNMDAFDHLQPNDLKQAAVVIAGFVYNAAQRNEKIPRK